MGYTLNKLLWCRSIYSRVRSITKVDVVVAVICVILWHHVFSFLLWRSSWKPWAPTIDQHVPPSIPNDKFQLSSDFITYFHGTYTLDGTYRNQNKTILIWTDFFNLANWATDQEFAGCLMKSCHITFDKTLASESDAVLFHASNLDRFSLPEKRSTNQRWIVYSWEPPYKSSLVAFLYNNVFNWTMLFREDSDIRVRSGPQVVQSGATRLQRERILDEINANIKTKTKLASARVGNCLTYQTNRLWYIREMQKHMPIDFYGYCGDIDCAKTPCQNLKNYKFYLAFENGYCRGYVSEKFWNAISWGSVPVVSGGSHIDTYKNLAPPGSYINAADFASPKELAEFLIYLDGNDMAYKEFFNWKLDFVLKPISPWCDMCSALHADDQERPQQVYSDLHGWYLEDTCDYRAGRVVIFPLVIIIGLIMTIISFIITTYVYYSFIQRHVQRSLNY